MRHILECCDLSQLCSMRAAQSGDKSPHSKAGGLLYTQLQTNLILVILLLGFGLPILRAQSLPVRFTDITKQTGIAFRHVASPEKKYLVESMSGGVAMFDYDNDGWMDIYFVNSLSVDLAKSGGKSKSMLYHNNGDGSFTD
ncbi:MAG: enediyne biosynthesis protein, partial [Blastocatellia bacterium]